MTRTFTLLAAAAVLCGAAAAATHGAGRVTLLVLQDAAEPAMLLVERKPAYGMRWLETEASLCARQRQGSPLHSIYLPASFCRAAVPASVASPRDVRLRLPGTPPAFLREWASS